MARFTKPQLEQLIIDYANGYGIDPAIAVAQLKRESANYRDDVVYGPFVGGAGERGVAQFTPATWASFASRYGPHNPNAYEPEYSLAAWGDYMTYLLGVFNGDIYKALVAYNGGPGHLTNPERFGTPSVAALKYGSEVLAKAGVEPVGSSGVDVTFLDPNASSNVDNYLKDFFGAPNSLNTSSKLLLFGGLALLGIVLLKR